MNSRAVSFKKENLPLVNSRMHLASHFYQRGFGIIEIGIVLVIVSMLLAVTLGYVRGVLADNRANDEAKDLPQTVLRIQRLYNNRSTYAGATALGLIGNGVFPAERFVGAGNAYVNNRWGGTITPAVTNLATTSDAISLTYTNVPQAECNSLIAQVERSVARIAAGLNGNTTVKPYSVSGGTLDINALGLACASGGSSNTLVFTIGVTQ